MAGQELRDRGFTIILDSNFFFIPAKFGVDIFEEMKRLLGSPIRCVVTSPVLEEMQLLKKDAKPLFKKKIGFALSIAERCERVEVMPSAGETVDDSIVRTARLLKYPVATNDSQLRKRLRSEGIPVIYLRKRAYLEIEGSI